jgi:hypothetical protein
MVLRKPTPYLEPCSEFNAELELKMAEELLNYAK